MKLFNSLHNQIEEFKPIEENKVSMYVCGPTVYNHAHIGNARPMIVFDTLKKTLEAIGYEVTFVSNYTDVDDKIINKAKEEGVSEKEISERYIKAYQKVREMLHVQEPDIAPKVTETMEEIIAFIKALVEKGYAYEIDGDVYFKVDKIATYGSLSNQQIEDLKVGARIDENSKKENPLDFTLWKKTETGIAWDSVFSCGRPGWHTECVVMIQKVFQKPCIDIHGGGMDLKFPHHENEIAQSQALFHSSIANYWLHNGMVNIDGEKMSKSLGNVIWAKDMVKQLGANVMRWLMLATHYRSPLNINEDSIQAAKKELDKVLLAHKQASIQLALKKQSKNDVFDVLLMETFLQAMQDDLNTPNAYMAVFECSKQINAMVRKKDYDITQLAQLVVTLEKMLDILGIEYPHIELQEEDVALFVGWDQAKQDKNYELADSYRKQLQDKGLL